MAKKERLLIIEDRQADLDAYSRGMSLDYEVIPARTLDEARAAVARDITLVLSDICLSESDRHNRDGLVFLRWVREQHPGIPVVMMTAFNDMDMAVQALNQGAEYFIRKPINLREVRTVLRNLARQVQLQRKATALEERLRQYEPWEIVGESEPIRSLRKQIQRAAEDGQVTVMVTGETGSGKELVARAIHQQGPRKGEPFVDESLKVREGASGLLESLLFGHEKGAFTDAHERYRGVFERANGGVLFLDEIGDLDPATQVKLLRVLETRCFRRMGGTEDIRVDMQLVVATNRPLERAVADGAFRSDLYFRLNVFQIRTPALREIASDIPALARHFLAGLRAQGRTAATGISPKALELMAGYSWPGNVRELRNYIERAAIFAEETITPEHLPDVVRSNTPLFGTATAAPMQFPPTGVDLGEVLARAELQCIEAALRAAHGKKGEAWKLLGLNDRYALTRRVKAIASAHAAVFTQMPYLVEQYGGIGESESEE